MERINPDELFKKKKKKKLLDELEDLYDIDEDSDIVIHEKYTKEKKIKK